MSLPTRERNVGPTTDESARRRETLAPRHHRSPEARDGGIRPRPPRRPLRAPRTVPASSRQSRQPEWRRWPSGFVVTATPERGRHRRGRAPPRAPEGRDEKGGGRFALLAHFDLQPRVTGNAHHLAQARGVTLAPKTSRPSPESATASPLTRTRQPRSPLSRAVAPAGPPASAESAISLLVGGATRAESVSTTAPASRDGRAADLNHVPRAPRPPQRSEKASRWRAANALHRRRAAVDREPRQLTAASAAA